MKNVIIILLVFGLGVLLSCEKPVTPPTCVGECLGVQTLYLNGSDYYLDNNMVFKFVNQANDTILLTSTSTYTTPLTIKGSCNCTDEATNITSVNLFKNYVFKNKNFALQFHIGANNIVKVVWQAIFADTNNILHQTHTASDTTGSVFQISDYNAKRNDLDTVHIRGTIYYGIVTSFDYTGATNPKALVTQITYSKGFGIISFTYNNSVYVII